MFVNGIHTTEYTKRDQMVMTAPDWWHIGMERLKRCCCGCSVHDGALIIAIVGIIARSLAVIHFIAAFVIISSEDFRLVS